MNPCAWCEIRERKKDNAWCVECLTEDERRRIPVLQAFIRPLRKKFHAGEDIGMSEPLFDRIKHWLYELEQKHPDLITKDSPTQTVESGLE